MAKAKTKTKARVRVAADTAAGPTPEERARMDAEAEAALAAQEQEAEAVAGGIEVPPDPLAKPVDGMTPEQRATYEERQAAEAALAAQEPEEAPQGLLVVCNSCRSTSWTVKRATTTAISIICAKCGGKASVKAAVGPANIPAGLAALAVENYVHPTPKAAPPPSDGDDEDGAPSLGDQGFMTIRARLTREQYEMTVRRAMEAVRVMNNRDEAFRVQQWMGTALEYICADFLSGVDPRVLEIVDAQEEAVTAEAEKFRAQGEELPAKRARAIRAQTRDTLADALGAEARRLDHAPHQTPDLDAALAQRAAEAAEKAAAAAADDRILDDGALHRAVVAAIRDYAEEYAAAHGGDRLVYLVGGPTNRQDLIARWDAAGGFLLAVRGDARTRSGAGLRPEVLLWIAEEFEEATLALDAEYVDALFDILPEAVVEVVELLPKGYSELPEENQWDEPSFASRREEMK